MKNIILKSYIKHIYSKYKDVIPYAFFGVCTTIINIISYAIAASIGLNTVASTVIAWIISVLFAYLTNRKWVFKSQAYKKIDILKEIFSFFACRLLTGIIDVAIMFVFVDKFNLPGVPIKIAANIVVIVLNYIASKFYIFKNPASKRSPMQKKIMLDLVIIAFIAFISILITEYSPLGIWKSADSSIDSSVFRYIALEMEDGDTPYLDTFDHKGPLLYLINWVGLKISPNHGIWVIESISIFFTLLFSYLISKKIAANKNTKTASILATAITATIIFPLYDGGNYAQVFALPFIASSYFIFIDYITSSKINHQRLLLFGIGLGATAMLQANISIIWAFWGAIVATRCITKKHYKNLLIYILLSSIGACIILIPIIIWLSSTGAINEFFNAYFTFNSLYATNKNFASILNVILTFAKNPILLSGIIISIYLLATKRNLLSFSILMSILISLFFASMSGRPYKHYALTLMPLITYPISFFISRILDCRKNQRQYPLAAILIILIYICPFWLDAINNLSQSYNNRGLEQHDELTLKISNVINKYLEDDNDKISVYGNWNIIYLLSKHKSASKYSYQFDPASIDHKILENYFTDLEKNKPKIIVMEPKYFTNGGRKEDKEMEDFLSSHNYSLIWQSEKNDKGEGASIYLLR